MKNFFNFNYSHRNGIIFLSLIVIIVFIIKDHLKYAQKTYDFSVYKQEVSQLREIKRNKKSTYTDIKAYKKNPIKPTKKKIEINSADTLMFESLPAIGEVFARRICKYRQLLGGFHSIHQLMEVYGMDSSRLTTIQPYLEIDTIQIKKININSSNIKQLQKHPYISYKTANAIYSYKSQHGVYKTLTDILNIHLIDSLKFCKIAPYLTTDDKEPIN